MILVFTFVHLIVSAIEREQFIIDYNVGDVEYKDITVLHYKAYNHFQHYYALVDSDTAVVISLRSQQADTMVGKTIKKVPLRQLHSYNIPFWAVETNNLNIGYFNCKGDTIYFDRAKNKIYLRDDERIKILKWRKTVRPEGDTIEVSEEYPSKWMKAIGSISYNRDSCEIFLAGNCSMPRFPGGDQAMREYLMDKVHYPDNVDCDTIQGTVVVKFYVNKIGKVTDVIIKKSLHYYFDSQVVKLCLSFPDFIPAKDVNGANKGEWLTLPISFGKSDFDGFKKRELANDDIEIYSVASQPPAFPGGDAQLFKFISQNLQYPSICNDAQIQGKVILRLVVKANGEIGEVEVIRSVDPSLDREAIRVARLLPTFIPARNALGENVDCWYILPVIFKVAISP